MRAYSAGVWRVQNRGSERRSHSSGWSGTRRTAAQAFQPGHLSPVDRILRNSHTFARCLLPLPSHDGKLFPYPSCSSSQRPKSMPLASQFEDASVPAGCEVRTPAPTHLDEQLLRLACRRAWPCPLIRSRLGHCGLSSPATVVRGSPVAHAEGRIADRLVKSRIRRRLCRCRQHGQRTATTLPQEGTYVGDTAVGLDECRRLWCGDDSHSASLGVCTQRNEPGSA